MHWYKFKIDGSQDLLVCRAKRKKDIEAVINRNLLFIGCVDKNKIGSLRSCQYHTVFNSIHKMISIMAQVAPELVIINHDYESI